MRSALPLGGSLRSALASRPLCPASCAPDGSESTGFWIAPSLAKVIMASTTRMTEAPAVQPISRLVLPRICAATAPLRARNLMSAYTSAPSTATKMISAMTRVM